ncbi:Membrane associated serine protease, rhomboid family [Halogeometricum rufum]|uniref:Membrane associated serine protease, rhomboid family n=1 Tax=Halogeometricum rufum TaxID=553469 RepID=A0A1I6G4S4_9EURY|nr:rhomboid family intramembrane serine protease [Halogeometricum rufum]SFR37213.1 Membrane associated serine protease, rhomboid family [Halogeometricum rufum]
MKQLSRFPEPFSIDTLASELREYESPITLYLSTAIATIFTVQLILTIQWGSPSIYATTGFLFLNGPEIAWILSPLLHRGPFHFLANILLLLLIGRVTESHLSRTRFLALAVLSSIISIAALAAFALEFGSKEYVAAYGISGLVFALLGFSLVHLQIHEEWNEPDALVYLLAICAVLLIVFEVGKVIILQDPLQVNAGHVSGWILGIVFAYAQSQEHCSVLNRAF